LEGAGGFGIKSGGKGASAPAEDDVEDSPVPKAVLLVGSGGKGASGIFLKAGVSEKGSCLVFGDAGVFAANGLIAGGFEVVGVFGPAVIELGLFRFAKKPPGLGDCPKLNPAETGLAGGGPDEVDGEPKSPPDAGIDDGKS
jgi:hypothetical protein